MSTCVNFEVLTLTLADEQPAKKAQDDGGEEREERGEVNYLVTWQGLRLQPGFVIHGLQRKLVFWPEMKESF